MTFMTRPSRNKRRVPKKAVNNLPEGIEVYTTSKEFRKEEKESKQREQEAARESD
jgi:hypothetical protein